jgi:phage tail-like protein
MTTTKLPTVYADAVSEVDDASLTGAVFISNRIPEDLENDVPIDALIELVANIINDSGLAAGTITVTDSVGLVVAWTLSGGFHASYSASAHNSIISQGAGGADEFRWQIIRSTNWLSQERVVVRIQLTPTSGAALDVTYAFTVEDVTVPALISAETRGLKRLRLTFNEPIAMVGVNSALRVRDLSGRTVFVAPNQIEVDSTIFPADLTGEYICATGCVQAVNNRYAQIASSVVGTPNVITTVESGIVTEPTQIAHRLFSSPYLLKAVIRDDKIFPAFTPCITSAVQIDAVTIELILDQAVTPDTTYQITAVNLADAADPANVRDTVSVTFVAEKLPQKAGRRFSLWDFIPQGNKRDDTSHDLERLIRVFDEPLQQMLADIDRYDDIYEIDTAEGEFLNALLLHLGNPYTFLRNDLEKRKVATNLVATYKVSGAEIAIEQAIQQILGFPADVIPFNGFDDQWILGDSELGIDTFLGPSALFLIYSFKVDVAVDALSPEETTIIQEICDTWRPAHTHCVQINAVGAPP